MTQLPLLRDLQERENEAGERSQIGDPESDGGTVPRGEREKTRGVGEVRGRPGCATGAFDQPPRIGPRCPGGHKRPLREEGRKIKRRRTRDRRGVA